MSDDKDKSLPAPMAEPYQRAGGAIPTPSFVTRIVANSRTKAVEARTRYEEAEAAYLKAMVRRGQAEEELAKFKARATVWSPEAEEARARREYDLEDARQEAELLRATADVLKAEAEARAAEAEVDRAEADSIKAKEERDDQILKRKEGKARRKRAMKNIGKPKSTNRPRQETAAEAQDRKFDNILQYGTTGEASVRAEKKIKKLLEAIEEQGREPTDEELENIKALRNEAQSEDLSRRK